MQGQNPSLSARYYNSDLSLWISVDPLVDKYPNLSPYTYCAGNPVRLVDEDGREVWIIGEEARAFFKEVKKGAKALNISVKMDKTGKLQAKYKGKEPISEDGQKFMNAVEDRQIKIIVNATLPSEYSFGGTFGGSDLFGEVINGTWISQYAIAKQTVIPSELKALDEFYNQPGKSSLHEITEAHIGAKIAMDENVISTATGENNPLYKRSHNAAIPQSGPVHRFLYDANDNPTTDFDKVKWIDWNVGFGTSREINLKTTKVY
ncbi:MAG: hypothetical protein IJT51_02270 [Bacteroidales bacterium]|nr:hypothetical protein [Bacteroidales bacterium]